MELNGDPSKQPLPHRHSCHWCCSPRSSKRYRFPLATFLASRISSRSSGAEFSSFQAIGEVLVKIVHRGYLCPLKLNLSNSTTTGSRWFFRAGVQRVLEGFPAPGSLVDRHENCQSWRYQPTLCPVFTVSNCHLLIIVSVLEKPSNLIRQPLTNCWADRVAYLMIRRGSRRKVRELEAIRKAL